MLCADVASRRVRSNNLSRGRGDGGRVDDRYIRLPSYEESLTLAAGEVRELSVSVSNRCGVPTRSWAVKARITLQAGPFFPEGRLFPPVSAVVLPNQPGLLPQVALTASNGQTVSVEEIIVLTPPNATLEIDVAGGPGTILIDIRGYFLRPVFTCRIPGNVVRSVNQIQSDVSIVSGMAGSAVETQAPRHRHLRRGRNAGQGTAGTAGAER